MRQFMGCYWMETADLVYGDLVGAVNAFLEMEPTSLRVMLLSELQYIRDGGYLVDRPVPSSDKERFWQQFGARWLTELDAELISLMLRPNRREPEN